jgi:hypothetical protein
MSARILLATRKGLLDFQKRGGDWINTRTSFAGQPVSAVLRDPVEGLCTPRSISVTSV